MRFLLEQFERVAVATRPATSQTAGAGTNWVDPIHDDAGNMTTIPQPQDPASGYTLTYDAWNRLVTVNDGSSDVQVNEFDGLNRRIIRDETLGSGKKIHFYYNQQWQVLEERVEVSGTIDPEPLAQYVYHPDYVDSIAVRYYDADTDGSGIVDYHYLQDANFNVIAVTDDQGTVQERYAYTPYGEVTRLIRPEADIDDDWDVDGADFLAIQNGDAEAYATWQAQHGWQGAVVAESTIDNEYLYTGRRLDPETGLQLNRNRFYASHLGRWVNRDPLEFDESWMNLYEYVYSDPIFFIDFNGLQGQPGSNPRPGPKWPKDFAKMIDGKKPIDSCPKQSLEKYRKIADDAIRKYKNLIDKATDPAKIKLTFRGSRLGSLRFTVPDFQGFFVKSNLTGYVRAALRCLNNMLRF